MFEKGLHSENTTNKRDQIRPNSSLKRERFNLINQDHYQGIMISD